MKACVTAIEAVEGIQDGATVLIGGFGSAGQPTDLVHALIEQGARDLTIVSNNAGSGEEGIAALLLAQRVRKIVCSFPRTQNAHAFEALYRAGELELELVPQGTLVERIRAGGAGIGGFYTPTAVGTVLADGKEVRTIDGKDYVFERPISADVSLISARVADERGNLVYRKTARNFGPVMATAAKLTVAQVVEIVPVGGIDPEAVVTPGIFVDRVVAVQGVAHE